MYYQVQHIYVGNLCHFKDCQVYIYFPKLYDQESEGLFLSDNKNCHFTNVLLTKIYDIHPRDVCQHLPTTWEDAACRAKSRAAEQGFKPEKAKLLMQVVHYIQPPCGLRQVSTK